MVYIWGMEVRIETLSPKKLVGKRLNMSLNHNRTLELWKSFMPRRKEIQHTVGTDLFSMQVYDVSYDFNTFNPDAEFEKWAAIEISDASSIPADMQTFALVGGLYAVFIHKGAASEGERTFRYIFKTWLPNSGYTLDNRPHFEILGDKYKNNAPDSEEEIWIPVKEK